jgi:hypothetical protein
LILFVLIIFSACFAFAELNITGTVEWDTLHIRAAVSLDMVAAGIRLPVGRTQAESDLRAGYLNLIQPGILALRVDSSSTIADVVASGDLNLLDIERLALGAQSVAPALSPDMRKMISTYTIPLASISSSLLRHTRPAPIMRTLTPVSAARYTGIVIIASEELPIHGMRASTLAIPCLFPKIWDSGMNLIYDKNMLVTRNSSMVLYAPHDSIFQKNPSGLTPQLAETVGDRPLRIFARGVFGTNPTDLIIDRDDALLIISSEENRRLLSEGKVAFILNDSVVRYGFEN